MQVIRGDYGGRSTAIGYLRLCRVIGKRRRAMKTEAQKERLFDALRVAREEIGMMKKSAVESVGEEHGEIYGIYLNILEFEPLLVRILSEIDGGASSEDAIGSVLSEGGTAAEGAFSFRHVKDCFDLLLRVLEDVKCPEPTDPASDGEGGSYIYVSDGEGSGELISLLRGVARGEGREPAGVVCVGADELKRAVSMELPSLLIARDSLPDDSYDGITAILDCDRRRLILDPDLEELEKYSRLGRQVEIKQEELLGLIEMRSETPSGRRIRLFDQRKPTIGSSSAVVGATGADRGTMILTDAIPANTSEQVQYELYKKLAESPSGVTVRLFERPETGGGDSLISPIGLRGGGLFALFRQEYKTQIKALLRAAAHGSISAVLPSVCRRDELCGFRSALREARGELKESGHEFSELTEICVELSTPAALMNAAELCADAALAVVDLDTLVSLISAAELCDPISAEQLKSGIAPTLSLCSRAIAESGVAFAVRGELCARPELTHALIDCGFECFFLEPDAILSVKEGVLSYREGSNS